MIELKIYIKVVSIGYLILWKRTKVNLDFIQKNENELNAEDVKKELLKSFEKIQTLIITPDGLLWS